MSWGSRPGRPGACTAAVLAAFLLTPASAPAKPREPISGRLSQAGYTVIALAANGDAASDVAGQNGAFSIVPPANNVTLQLRALNGTYAGPVVFAPRRNFELKRAQRRARRARVRATRAKRKVGAVERTLAKAKRRVNQASGKSKQSARRRLKRAKRGLERARRRRRAADKKLRRAKREAANRPKWAIEGVKAGAKLEMVAVNPVAGYAKAAGIERRPWETRIDTTLKAKAKNGVPIGAGNFGRVASDLLDGDALGDLDRDGVPDSLDVDDDGDLVLDTADPETRSSASASGGFPSGSRIQADTTLQGFRLFDSDGHVVLDGGVNVNGGSTDAEIAAAQREFGELSIFWSGMDPGSGELDCGFLPYCSAGGTGKLQGNESPFHSAGSSFPECCDSDDSDGFGSLTESGRLIGHNGMILLPGASVDEIGTGDVLIEHSTVNGATSESATTVGFAFSTVPVLAAYSDGQGNTATLSYPNDQPPAPVRAGPNGDVILDLTLWRPQRRKIPGEDNAGNWTNIGHLDYMTSIGVGSVAYACPASTLSEDDANLSPTPSSPYPGPFPNAGGFTDLAPDQSSESANSLTFTLNLTQCMVSNGLSFEPNEEVRASWTALAPNSDTGQLATAVSYFNFVRQE